MWLRFILLLITAGVASTVCQYSADTDEEMVKGLIQESFDEIFSELNISDLGKYYTDDFLLLEHGEVWDNEVIKNYMTTYAKVEDRPIRTNAFEFIKIRVDGDRAWIAYHNDATFVLNGEVVREMHWLESATAVRMEKGWRLDMLHSTRKSEQ